MSFKKTLFGFFLALVFGNQVLAGYQTQGFTNFQEDIGGNSSFVCSSQCFIIIDSLGSSDYLQLNGNFDGNGQIGYGFLIGQNQLVPGETLNLNGNQSLNQKFAFSQTLYYGQIPKDAKIMLIINGNVKGSNIDLKVDSMGLEEKISMGWKDFWTFDTYKPYTINLLKGPMVLGESANYIFYWIFIIGAIVILIKFGRKSEKCKKGLLILGISLWIIYDLRMGLEFIGYYRNDYNTYISKPKYEKIYRDRGDFYAFVDFAKDNLKDLKQGQEISFYTDNTRPFPGSMIYFLYPYNILVNKNSNKYYIIYGYSNFQLSGEKLVLSGENIGDGKLIKFKDYAFIFIKN